MITTLESGFNEKGIAGIISKIHKHKSIKFTYMLEKQIVEIQQPEIYEKLWIVIFHMVITCTGWIYNGRDETGRWEKSYRDQKHLVKTQNQIEEVKNGIGKQQGSRIQYKKVN